MMLNNLKSLLDWRARRYAAPSPPFVKRATIMRNAVAGGIWVETGTFKGDTTALLAKGGSRVYTLEPAEKFYQAAARRFAGAANVTVLNGPSETLFPELLPTLSGDINFWLDGHYSAGATFQGAKDTPIIAELDQIAENIGNFGKMAVMVDDLRCFAPEQPEFRDYPPLRHLVEWAENLGLIWHMEQDIFIARR